MNRCFGHSWRMILIAVTLFFSAPAAKAVQDTDGDGFLDGPDQVVESNSMLFLHVGEDKNGNGSIEPLGEDGIAGTKDDETDPRNPGSRPNGPARFRISEGVPRLSPDLPEPNPNRYYFFSTLTFDQIPGKKQDSHSYGRGTARFVLDTDAKTLTYQVAFRGLKSGGEDSTFIGRRASQGLYERLFNLPRGLDKIGTWNYGSGKTPEQIAQLQSWFKAGELFVAVTTSEFPNGELIGNLDMDRDCDGLTDIQERDLFGTDPLDRDSDDDGLGDGEEVFGLGKLKDFERSGELEYLSGMEEIEAGITDFQVSDLSRYEMTRAVITEPMKWDTDEDGLSDGIEVGVTEKIEGFEQNNINIAGTDFPDEDLDGIHDVLEFRLVDLGPEEPNTNPQKRDTNDDGFEDGQDDSNRDGRLDYGERDPVKGFYRKKGGGTLVNGFILLRSNEFTPYGPGHYFKTEFHFGSAPYTTLTIVEPLESEVHVYPRILHKGPSGSATVEFFVPDGQEVPNNVAVRGVGSNQTSTTTTSPSPTPTPIPDPEDMAGSCRSRTTRSFQRG